MKTLLAAVLLVSSCGAMKGPAGEVGPTGPQGPAGVAGARGADGANGLNSVQEHSGTRLKRVYLNGADGSKWAVGWYDSKLQQDVAMWSLADGSQRFLPTSAVIGQAYYLDDACTQPIFQLGGGLPPYVLILEQASAVSKIFTAEPLSNSGPGPFDFYTLTAGACNKATNQVVARPDIYRGKTEIAATEFVGVTRSVDSNL